MLIYDIGTLTLHNPTTPARLTLPCIAIIYPRKTSQSITMAAYFNHQASHGLVTSLSTPSTAEDFDNLFRFALLLSNGYAIAFSFIGLHAAFVTGGVALCLSLVFNAILLLSKLVRRRQIPTTDHPGPTRPSSFVMGFDLFVSVFLLILYVCSTKQLAGLLGRYRWVSPAETFFMFYATIGYLVAS
jgi:hypothetical protein